MVKCRLGRRLSSLVLASVALGSIAAAPADAPAAHSSAAFAPPGTDIRVFGEHWPSSSVIDVRLCGNDGLDGSTDCDMGRTQTVGSAADGQFSTNLTVSIPPSPCPCVIRVSSSSTPTTANVPLGVLGAPSQTPTVRVPTNAGGRSLEVQRVALEGRDDWTVWFGAAPRRTLVVTVHNSRTKPMSSPPLFVKRGTGADPQTTVRTPAVADIPAGGTRTLRIPVDGAAPTFGRWKVHGSLGSSTDQVTFGGSTSSWPWGLIVLALVLLQLALLRVRNAARRRRLAELSPHPSSEIVATDPAVGPGPDAIAARAGAGAIASLSTPAAAATIALPPPWATLSSTTSASAPAAGTAAPVVPVPIVEPVVAEPVVPVVPVPIVVPVAAEPVVPVVAEPVVPVVRVPIVVPVAAEPVVPAVPVVAEPVVPAGTRTRFVLFASLAPAAGVGTVDRGFGRRTDNDVAPLIASAPAPASRSESVPDSQAAPLDASARPPTPVSRFGRWTGSGVAPLAPARLPAYDGRAGRRTPGRDRRGEPIRARVAEPAGAAGRDADRSGAPVVHKVRTPVGRLMPQNDGHPPVRP